MNNKLKFYDNVIPKLAISDNPNKINSKRETLKTIVTDWLEGKETFSFIDLKFVKINYIQTVLAMAYHE